MKKQVLQFYGSDEDLKELREALSAAGFQEHHDNVVRASHDLIPPSIAVVAALGIGKCIRTYLQTRGKRLVSRMVSEGEDKTVIRGDFSAKEVERILKIPYSHNIENDDDDA